jgi:predicted DNA-binding ribbon-helix-helix protein
MKSANVKHSVTIGGRRTSVSLENAFWKALGEIAQRWHVTPSQLIREINTNRKEGNLSSAIRRFVLEVYKDQIEPPQPKPKGGDLKLVG